MKPISKIILNLNGLVTSLIAIASTLRITLYLVILLFVTMTPLINDSATASETEVKEIASPLIEKVAKGYSNKFCNAIGIGLSPEGALKLSITENKEPSFNPSLWLELAISGDEKIKTIDQSLLIDTVAYNVIRDCGIPIGLTGSKGIQEFKLRLEQSINARI